MKRILHSCVLLIALFLFQNTNGQVFNFTMTPNVLCYNPIVPVYTVAAAQTASSAGSPSYGWNVVPEPALSPTCQPTWVTAPGNGTAMVASFTCCGTYSVYHYAYVLGNPVPVNTAVQTFTLVCPTGGSVAVSTSPIAPPTGPTGTICSGASATLTSFGAATATWVSKTGATSATVAAGNGVQIVSTPSANTTYTYFGTSPVGCPISGTAAVSVAGASLAVTPTSASLCPGAPINLSAIPSVITNSNYTSGTATTGIQWFAPGGTTPFAFTANTTTTATAGIYLVNLLYTGAAGTCTLPATVNISTVSTVSVNVATSAASVCPGALFTMTAAVAATPQTAGSNYTWTAQPAAGPPSSFTGSLVNLNPTQATDYTVDVTYYGCTGSATAQVGMSTLTVNLSSSSPSTCPNRSYTLSATGGITYTFLAKYSSPPNTTITLGVITATSGAATMSTSAGAASIAPCATYIVNSFGGGCTGSATTTVCRMVLNTQITPSSYSVCPNTNFTVYTNNGIGTTNSYTVLPTNQVCNALTNITGTASSGCVFGSGNMNTGGGGGGVLTVTVVTDSLGCRGSNSILIQKRVLNPFITPSSPSVCPNSQVNLTAFGGAGTSFTFTAPYLLPPLNTSSVVNNGTVNNVSIPVSTPPPAGFTFTVQADSAGCVGSANIQIGLLNLSTNITTTIVPSYNGSVCPCSNFTLYAGAGAGATYTFASSYFPITTGNSFSNEVGMTAPCNPNNFPFSTFTVSADSAGCVGTKTLQLGLHTLSNLVTLSVSGVPSASVCPGQSFALTALVNNTTSPGTIYSFSLLPLFTPVPTGTANNIGIGTFPTNALTATYQVVADSANCVGTQTIQVNRRFLTNLTLTVTPPFICAGKPATLTAGGVGSNSTSPTNYTFSAISPTAPPVAGPSKTLVVTPIVQTAYAVIADSMGCTTATANIPTVTVNIIPGLTLTPSATSSFVCSGLPSTLTAIGTSSLPTSYTWSPAGATATGTLQTTAGSATAVSTPTSSTIYTINAEDAIGCRGTATIAVNIDPNASLPVTVSAPVNTVCPGLNTLLTASCPISPVTFTWTPAIGLIGAANTPTALVQPSITTSYSATVNNGWGCTGVGIYTVYVNNYPQLSTSATATALCVGYTSTITAFGANSYTWTSASFSNAIAQQSISVVAGTYSLLGSNGGGCTAAIVVNIGQQGSLTINVSASSGTTCIENNSPKYSKPVVLSASGANTYVWFPYNPANMTYSIGPSTTVRPPATITYTVVGSNNTCSGSNIITVVVIPQFSMNVIPPLPYMCLGDSLKLSITGVSTLAVGPPSAFSYSWAEAANAPPISITSKFTPTVMVFPKNTTTYSTQVKDSRGCVSLPRLVTVTVLPKPITAVSIPTINSIPTNSVCFVGLNPGPLDVLLTLSAVNKNTNLQFGVVPTYTWVSPYPVKYNSILTPVNNTEITINAPLRLPGLVTYSVISGYNGVSGCRKIDTVSVRVVDCRPLTNITFTTAEKVDTICARTCITYISLTDTMAGGPQTFTWSFPGGNPASSNASVQTVCYNLANAPGEKGYNVILRVSSPYPKNPSGVAPGSSADLGVPNFVKVVDVPNVTIIAPGQLSSDTTVRIGTPIRVTASGAFYYEWSPNYNISTTRGASVTMTPYRTTQYILTGRNSSSCYSSDTLNVIVIQDCGEMYVPNAFTPNDDGANDVLYVRGICLKTLNFMVFNRWGEKVFETQDQSKGWDGTYKGELLNTGVFVFRLEGRTFDGKEYSAKGNITLIR